MRDRRGHQRDPADDHRALADARRAAPLSDGPRPTTESVWRGGFRLLAPPQTGFDAWGENLGEVCARSAEATFQIMGWPDTLAAAAPLEVVSRGARRDGLVRALLTDLLARFAADGLFVHRAVCASVEQSADGALEVRLTCAAGSVDLALEEALTPLRGVAPGVRVWDESGLVRARVLLDT